MVMNDNNIKNYAINSFITSESHSLIISYTLSLVFYYFKFKPFDIIANINNKLSFNDIYMYTKVIM